MPNEKQSVHQNQRRLREEAAAGEQPKLVTDEEIANIRLILNHPLETDEDYQKLGRAAAGEP